MDHKFRIAGIRLNEAHFARNPKYTRVKNKPIEITHTVEIKYKQKDEIVNVLVSVSSDSENQPFRFSVAWEGLFAFEEMPSKENLERIVHINCASIIYPYVREYISDLTRRAGMTPLNLAPLNFVAMYEENLRRESPKASRKIRQKSKA
jgi:preprotein translocase subunit SecB